MGFNVHTSGTICKINSEIMVWLLMAITGMAARAHSTVTTLNAGKIIDILD